MAIRPPIQDAGPIPPQSTPRGKEKIKNNMAKETLIWDGVVIHLQEGDVLTSKKGIALKTAALGKIISTKKILYRGKGLWEALDDPAEIPGVIEKGP
jgi:hypothetical protein